MKTPSANGSRQRRVQPQGKSTWHSLRLLAFMLAFTGCGLLLGPVRADALPAPAGLSAQPGNGSVVLSWSPVTGAVGYLVRRATVTGGPDQIIERVAQAPYADTTVRNAQPYFYVVAALASDGNGGESPGSDSTEVTATPLWPPVAPSNLAAVAGDGLVYLSWTGGARTDRFEVWRSIGGAAWAKVAEPTAAAYTDTGLTNGQLYAYYVLGRNSVDASGHRTASPRFPLCCPPSRRACRPLASAPPAPSSCWRPRCRSGLRA